MAGKEAKHSNRTGLTAFKWIAVTIMILLLIFFFFYFVLPVITSEGELDEDIKINLESDE